MRYVVKPACSFFVDHKKKVEGDIISGMKAVQLKRVMHLVEPYDDEEPETVPETPQEPAVGPVAAVEGDDAPEAAPAPKRRRRAAAKTADA